MEALYPKVVCIPAHDSAKWKVILPFGKGEMPLLGCRFVKIDNTWEPLRQEWWQFKVARIDRSWAPDNAEWWEADFSSPIYLPFPQ